jgi:hypothetical protein
MTAQIKQTFGTAQEVRDYLVQFGFAPFRKGLTQGEFSANGRKARFSMCLLSKTGQSSMGAAASWGYVVTVE